MLRKNEAPTPAILSENQYRSCRLCPRQCNADRTAGAKCGTDSGNDSGNPGHMRLGYCGCTDQVKVARAALHLWEEPCISGPIAASPSAPAGPSQPKTPSGSGAVFFSGCTLGCRFCQNYAISHDHFGKEISVRELADIFLRLQEQGALNINLITATQYLPSVIRALDMVRDRLLIPVVYNCGGYERPQIVRALADYVDIWLPDLKYFDSSLAHRCSQAGDYFLYASQAIPQMIAQAGPPVTDDRGIMRSGVIVRHMVLPGGRTDSIRLLHWMKENLPTGGYLLSLLSQYTPAGEFSPAMRHGDSPAMGHGDSPAMGHGASPVGSCVTIPDSSHRTPPSDGALPKRTHPYSADSPHNPRCTHSPNSHHSTHSPRHPFPDLTRRITTFEYESVLNTAIDLGLTSGFMQQKSSAKEEYTPPFDLEGV